MSKTYVAGLARVNRRRALATGRTADLIPEQRAFAVRVGLHAMVGGRVGVALSLTLAEQLRKQLHGRFPLTETDPPVGQDEP